MQKSRNGRPRRDLSREVSGHPDPLRELIKIQHRRYRREARERCDRKALDTRYTNYEPSPHRMFSTVEADYMEEVLKKMRKHGFTIREVKRFGFPVLLKQDKEAVIRDMISFYELKTTTKSWWQSEKEAEKIYRKMRDFLASLSREAYFALCEEAKK